MYTNSPFGTCRIRRSGTPESVVTHISMGKARFCASSFLFFERQDEILLDKKDAIGNLHLSPATFPLPTASTQWSAKGKTHETTCTTKSPRQLCCSMNKPFIHPCGPRYYARTSTGFNILGTGSMSHLGPNWPRGSSTRLVHTSTTHFTGRIYAQQPPSSFFPKSSGAGFASCFSIKSLIKTVTFFLQPTGKT